MNDHDGTTSEIALLRAEGLVKHYTDGNVQALRGGPEVRVGEFGAIGDLEIGARHFNANDADLGIAGGYFRGGEVTRGDVVIIPEVKMNGLAAGEQFPDLRGKNAEVSASVGGGFGS